MSDAIVPTWHGNNYQARFFWDHALNLLDEDNPVAEVIFEADLPKAFDDVVVKYDPPVPRYGRPQRTSIECHQIKWHLSSSGRFGYRDLADPEYIGASKTSLLQRLKDAHAYNESGAIFTLVTTDRIRDDDPLGRIVSKVDYTILIEKLFDGTKTDRSAMGKVRKYWREHLGLHDDEMLREVIANLRVVDGYLSLGEMREKINEKAKGFGLKPCHDDKTYFFYDELARQLKYRKLNRFRRDEFLRFCEEEGLFVSESNGKDEHMKCSIRSFLGVSSEVFGASRERTLLLTDYFRERYLKEGVNWQNQIRPMVETFLRQMVAQSSKLRLILDAHASIAFLAGTVLNLKSGVSVELVQKGRVGAQIWRPDDNVGGSGQLLTTEKLDRGHGDDVAIILNVTHSAMSQVDEYLRRAGLNIGEVVSFTPKEGIGQQSIHGGSHAALIADQISDEVNNIRIENPGAVFHIFAACPNALLFFVGQQIAPLRPCTLYEFDFDRKVGGLYWPSFSFS
jgi:hypothetical protein